MPHPLFHSSAIFASLAIWLGSGPSALANPGAAIYQEKCAHCHGSDGQGDTDGYDEPLLGGHSAELLARLIERTMPDDEPDDCVGEEAAQVAKYIFDEFYSPAARQRKGLEPKPRVELLRLSVSQYRNAVADLIGHFTPSPTSRRGRRDRDDNRSLKPGIHGQYYQSKGMSKADKQRLERVDTQIDFDFGEGSPAEDIAADQFAIIWNGALSAPHTGYYDFRLRTQNGVRLYLNSDRVDSRGKLRDDSSSAGQTALVDAWVSSGKMKQHTARVYLLGGRQYPIRLEFFKYKEKNSSIRLEWRPPQGTWSVLDHNYLTTARARRTFVVDVPFPADDRSLGYERGSDISQEWHAATSRAAVITATEVISRLPLLSGVDEDDEDRAEKLAEFARRMAKVAFRRPLNVDEQSALNSLFGNSNPELAVRRAILQILSAPQFLYVDLTSPGEIPTQHQIAARLALCLWDSIPDAKLMAAADEGELESPEDIHGHAQRMLLDPRARHKMQNFFRHWLEMEERDLAKDKTLYPKFDESVISDLRHSLELFIDEVVWNETSDYRQLLLADFLVLNERLQELYVEVDPEDIAEVAEEVEEEVEVEEVEEVENTAEPQSDDDEVRGSERDANENANSGYRQIRFPAERRAGVLTHPYLLSAFAYHNNTSPIHRGVFLTRNIVGRSLKPPPIAVAFKDDEFAPNLTMREKITQLTNDRACMSCHSVINPLGFALENYDAVGRWRTNDNDKPVDATAKYITADGRTLEVRSARDVAEFAVASELAHRAFVAGLFHHLVKQDPAAYGADTLHNLRRQFVDDEFNIRKLMAHIAVLSATHSKQAEPN